MRSGWCGNGWALRMMHLALESNLTDSLESLFDHAIRALRSLNRGMSKYLRDLGPIVSPPETASINTVLYRGDKRTARKQERSESSFLDTIVGRRGSLRAILARSGTKVSQGPSSNCIACAVLVLSPRRIRSNRARSGRVLQRGSRNDSSGASKRI